MENNGNDIMDREEIRMTEEAKASIQLEEAKASIKLKRLKRNLIVSAVIGAAVLLAGGIIWFQGSQIAKLEKTIDEVMSQPVITDPMTPEISLDVINAEIREIGELATMEYLYTNAAKFSDSKQINDWSIPFTEKSFTIKWDGVIKAGVDVDQITTALDKAQDVLTVYLPQAEILSHDTDEDSVEILDQSDGVFNPISVEDKVSFDAASEKEMEARAIDNGLLERAQENAKKVISRLLNANPDIAEHYSIEFEFIQK